MRANHLAADRCPVADVILSLGGGELLGLGVKDWIYQETERQHDKRSEGFHTQPPLRIPGQLAAHED
jgi:hypothetical protein